MVYLSIIIDNRNAPTPHERAKAMKKIADTTLLYKSEYKKNIDGKKVVDTLHQ